MWLKSMWNLHKSTQHPPSPPQKHSICTTKRNTANAPTNTFCAHIIFDHFICFLHFHFQTDWLGSTSWAVSMFSAPLIIAFCRRKSTRLTAVIGGLVLALGILFTSFAKELHQVALSYGKFWSYQWKTWPFRSLLLLPFRWISIVKSHFKRERKKRRKIENLW